MCRNENVRNGSSMLVIGHVPEEVLKESYTNEWDRRLLFWSLEPITKTRASEHVLLENSQAFPGMMRVGVRGMKGGVLPTQEFLIECAGTLRGCVQSVKFG